MMWFDLVTIVILLVLIATSLTLIVFWIRRGTGEGHSLFTLDSSQEKLIPAHITLGPPRRIRLTHRPPQSNGERIRRGPPLTIQSSPRPLWYEKGWRKVNGRNEYQGNYAVKGRQFRGIISQPYAGRFQAHIWNPPLDDLKHNTYHRSCFNNGRSDGRYDVHFHLEPTSLNHAITSIEVVLEEALNGKRN